MYLCMYVCMYIYISSRLDTPGKVMSDVTYSPLYVEQWYVRRKFHTSDVTYSPLYIEQWYIVRLTYHCYPLGYVGEGF